MAIRCVHEAQLHEKNCFLTLTYSDEYLPPGETLVKRDFQLFMKRLRKRFKSERIRFYHCGEYGEQRERPHYHALLFGFEFPDQVLYRLVRGHKVFRSAILEELWGKGFCSIGSVTFQSAAYCARYILKKITGPGSEGFYQGIDKETGEIVDRLPEYTTMSLRPGIAAGWFEKFGSDVYPDDFVIFQGKKYKTPRFYDKLYEREAGEESLLLVKEARKQQQKQFRKHATPKRLAVREAVLESKLKLLKREFV